MAEIIKMPKIGMTVESCILVDINFKENEKFKKNDILFEFETDKTTTQETAKTDGYVLKVLVEIGDEVDVHSPVMIIGDKNESIDKLLEEINKNNKEINKNNKKEIKKEDIKINNNKKIIEKNNELLSPRAQTKKEELNINYKDENYKPISEKEIINIYNNKISSIPDDREYKEKELTGIRKTIKKHMQASLQELSHSTLFSSFDATNIFNIRKEFKKNKIYKEVTIGNIISFVVKNTIKKFPYINANILPNNKLREYKQINLGIAIDSEKGLIVPVIEKTNDKNIIQISSNTKEFIQKIKSNQINNDDLSNGTFTITNLGNLGIEKFTPIINFPEVAILGVGSAKDELKMINNEIKVIKKINLSISFDHGVMDGADAARFLKELIDNLENITQDEIIK